MDEKFKTVERQMWTRFCAAEMKYHGSDQRKDPREGYMHRIREIERAMKSGKISREEALEPSKKQNEVWKKLLVSEKKLPALHHAKTTRALA